VAQNYPSRPVRIVVPFGPGGVADITARIVAERMSGPLGQPVLVENRPGAGGVAAATAVAQAAPDGHTLLLISNANAVSATLFRARTVDPVADFAPISTLGYFDLVLIARPGPERETLAGWLARARARPGKLNVATISPGSTQNLAAELLRMSAGIDVQIVPYKATPEVAGAVLAGDADLAVEILAPLLGQIRSGVLRAVAVASSRRSAILPELPTVAESGVAGYEATSWNGLAAPAGTPAAAIERLSREVGAALAAPEVSKRLRDLGIEPRAGTPEALRAQLVADIAKWRAVIERARIPLL
jgi:tripartite-type tricarboxylate transporter receptor subunit TctC